MVNNNWIIALDTETSDWRIKSLDLWQVSMVPIEPRTLEILYDQEFSSYVRPDVKDWDAYEVATRGAANVNKITMDQLKDAPTESQVIDRMATYIKGYGIKKSAPIRAGFNINNFDNPILDNYFLKYGFFDKREKRQNLFNPIFSVDLMQMVFGYFENLEDGPPNYKLDSLRDFLGISKIGAHDASKDTCDTAEIIVRFLKLQRGMLAGFICPCGKTRKVTLRNSFNK